MSRTVVSRYMRIPGTACKSVGELCGSPRGGLGSTACCDRAPCVERNTGTGIQGAFPCTQTNDDRAGFNAAHAECGADTQESRSRIALGGTRIPAPTSPRTRADSRSVSRCPGSMAACVSMWVVVKPLMPILTDGTALGLRTAAPLGSTGLLGWLVMRVRKRNWCDGRGD